MWMLSERQKQQPATVKEAVPKPGASTVYNAWRQCMGTAAPGRSLQHASPVPESFVDCSSSCCIGRLSVCLFTCVSGPTFIQSICSEVCSCCQHSWQSQEDAPLRPGLQCACRSTNRWHTDKILPCDGVGWGEEDVGQEEGEVMGRHSAAC